MSKTIKITIGILISALLFYLFIKDVNKIEIVSDSGQGHGVGVEMHSTIFVAGVGDFEVGDEIEIGDDSSPERETVHILRIQNVISDDAPSFIVVDPPLRREYRVTAHANVFFPRLQRALVRTNYWWLLPSLLFTLLGLIIRAYRWRFFFPEHRKMRLNSLWVSVCIGYMANNILPFRMGEIIRAWILGKKENRSISESFGTIVMERVFDILSILILFVAFIFYFGSSGDVVLPTWLKQGAWVLSAISVLALIFLVSLRVWTDRSLKLIKLVLGPLPEKISSSILRLVESFIQGLSIFSSFSAIFSAFALSMVIWLDLSIAYYCLFLAVGIPSSVLISMFLIVGLAFAVSIPSAPGFIGTFHFVGKEILQIMGLDGNLEAYVLFAHAMAYIPVVVLGFIYLSLENLSLNDLRKSIPTNLSDPDR